MTEDGEGVETVWRNGWLMQGKLGQPRGYSLYTVL